MWISRIIIRPPHFILPLPSFLRLLSELKKSKASKVKSLTKAEFLSRVRGKGARFPAINGAFLEQDCWVMARLGVTWYDDATGAANHIAMGSYMPVGDSDHYHLVNEGVPEGSAVSFYLDIDAAGDESDPTLFTVESGAQYEAHFRATGTLGLEEFTYIGLDPVTE